MKVAVWREKTHNLLVEILNLLQGIRGDLEDVIAALDGGSGGGGGGGGGGDEPRYLEATLESLRAAYTEWPYTGKSETCVSLTQLCANFRGWLAARYVNVETVNNQWERHRYQETNPLKHADAFVLIRDRANPSRDIVVDFCYGSSEGGRLIEKLQCLWKEGPYSWWTDNAFLKG